MNFFSFFLRIAITFYLMMAIPFSVQAQNKELDKLYGEAEKAMKKRQWGIADSLYLRYVELFRSQGIKKNYKYTEVLTCLVRRYANMGKNDEAIALQKEVIEVRKTAPDCTDLQWASSMCDMATLYANKANYQQAIDIGEKAIAELKKILGEKHHFCCIALANLAKCYANRAQKDDLQKAVELSEKALDNMKTGTPEYAKTLNALVLYYSKIGNRVAAGKIIKKARKEVQKRLEEEGVEYATEMGNQAIGLANTGNYDDAISYANAAREKFISSEATNTMTYAKLLSNLATFYNHKQDYQKAVELLQEALPVYEQNVGKENSDYVRCMSDLSAVYKALGNMEKADEIAHTSDELSHSLSDQDNQKLAFSYSKQASVFASNGNYQRAIEYEQRAIDIYKTQGDSLNMAFAVSKQSSYIYAQGDRSKGIEKAEEALRIYRNRNDVSPHYAQVLNSAAILYYYNRDFVQAANYGRQAMDIYKQIGDTVNTIYARIMENNAVFAYDGGNTSLSGKILERALDLHNQLLGDSHPDNVPLLYNLAIFQSQAEHKEEAHKAYRKAFALQANTVRSNFLYLTSQERENYWKLKNYVFKLAPMLAYLDRDMGRMNTEAYNSLLFTKGILLNSDIDFRNLLQNSGDQTLLDQYEQLEYLRQEEEELFKQPTTSQTLSNAKKLAEDIYHLERALVKGCKEYGQFTDALNINTEQISKALAQDEAAIEFTDFYVEGVGTVYIALVLRSGDAHPSLVRLFDETDLKELKYMGGNCDFFHAMKQLEGINEIYNDPRLGKMLWGQILSQLTGVKTIYFSPTSLFYQLGIEYLFVNENQRIGDLYHTYRLSSTKFLVNHSHSRKVKQAVVYGGLDYEMSLEELQQQHNSIATGTEYLLALGDNSTDVEDAGQVRALDSLSLRGSVNYLPGTRQEVDNIVEQFMQNGVKTMIYMMQEGTEETFKSLSGKEQDIIHIATHGFSFSEEEIKKKGEQLVFLGVQEGGQVNALDYSGLLFSGANYVLKGNKLPDGIENGILTAREIATMNLGHVGLVVLSACQTGLGEIKEDGVFGIQRGFKKAGAKSLLMSLWKVSDQATNLMMTSFYEHLMEGASRHQAFAMAQQDVRDSDFNDPYFWASFILLDGLE